MPLHPLHPLLARLTTRRAINAAALLCGCTIAAGSAGCASEAAPLHYFDARGEVYVAPEFTPAQTEVVLAALDAWRDGTNGSVDFQVRIGHGSPQIRPAEQPDGVFGEFSPSAHPEIVIDPEKAGSEARLRNLTLHEVGHALGLEHIAHTNSVMFPIANSVQELDGWTLAAWRALQPAANSEPDL